jgi:hypothetical protein
MALGWAVISAGLHLDSKIAPAINATPACARRAA